MILRSRIIQPNIVKMSTEISKERLLSEIDNKTKAMVNLVKQLGAISNDLEPYDMLLVSIINRTINLNSAFTQLIRVNNFIAGAPLVRINLDSLLRMYASIISEHNDRNKFALAIISGTPVNEMKHRNSKLKLSDSRLVKEITEVKGMDWVNKVYKAGNSYVHFCDTIFFTNRKIANEEEQIIVQSVGLNDSMVPDDEKLGAIIWMNKIIDSIIQQCQIWMYEKCKRYNFNIEDLNNIR